MHLLGALEPIPQEFRNAVVAIGNFDGMHRGHQAVIGQLIEKAREFQLAAAVILFHVVNHRFHLGKMKVRNSRLFYRGRMLNDCPLTVRSLIEGETFILPRWKR